jgi:hypothetical protein
MKIAPIYFIFFCISSDLCAQFNVVPFLGTNSTRMTSTLDDEFSKGGSFGVGGVEVEWKKKSLKHKRFYVSALTGVSYLNNGFYRSYNFSVGSFYYTHSVTDLKMTYWQIPLIVRANFQPFQLLDELHVFLGVGVSNNILLKSKLSEEYTESSLGFGSIPPPPETFHYEDSRDVTSLRDRYNMFQRIDVGVRYKRVQVAFRFSKSLKDLYCKGLEESWGVPDDKSEYIQSHNKHGKIVEKYFEFVVGFRLFK